MLLLERGFAFVVSCAPATAAPSAVSAVTAANNLVMRGSMVCSPVRPLLAPAGRQLGGRHRSRESFRSTGHRRGNANVLKHRLCRTERPIALSSNDRLASPEPDVGIGVFKLGRRPTPTSRWPRILAGRFDLRATT